MTEDEYELYCEMYEESAAKLEYCSGYLRSEAERLAREKVNKIFGVKPDTVKSKKTAPAFQKEMQKMRQALHDNK